MSVLLVHYLAVMLPASTTPATINPFAMAVAIMPLPRNPTVMPSVAIFYYFYAVARVYNTTNPHGTSLESLCTNFNLVPLPFSPETNVIGSYSYLITL